MNRQNFSIRTLTLLLCVPLAIAQLGNAVPALVGFDRAMALLTKCEIPGGALANSQNGRLVYARGFGVADKTLKTPVLPDSLFRTGSISKPLTP